MVGTNEYTKNNLSIKPYMIYLGILPWEYEHQEDNVKCDMEDHQHEARMPTMAHNIWYLNSWALKIQWMRAWR